MEGKFFVYLFMLLALVGIGYTVHVTTEIDDANRELLGITGQIGMLEGHIKNQTAYLELRREVSALLTVVNIRQKENAEIRKEIASQRDREVETRRAFEQAIARSRDQSAGLVLNDPVLPSGLRLHNARVQRVDGDITTLIHAEGISKLTPQMLPQELKERFRFGLSTEISAPVPVTPAAPEVAATPAADADAAPPLGGLFKPDSLPAAQAQLDRLKKNLPYLEEELKKAEAESAAATSPSKRFYVKNRLDSINKEISELKSKITTAEADIKKLEASN